MADDIVQVLQQFTQQTSSEQPMPAGANKEDWQRANNQMDLKYGTAEKGLYDQFGAIQGLLNRDVQTQQQFGTLADEKMAQIGATLHGQLQEGADRTGAIYKGGEQKVGGIYDELLGNIDKTGAEGTALLQSQAQKLGQQESLTSFGNPLGRIQGSIAEMKTRALADKGNSVSNLVNLGAMMSGIAQGKVGDQDALQAQSRGDLQKQVQASISKLQLEYMTDSRKVLQDFSNLAKQKGADLSESLYALTDARNAREAKAAQDALEAQIKMADLQLKMQKAVQESDPNSLDNQLKKLKIGKLSTEIEDKLNNPDLTYISDAQGQNNFNDFLGKITKKNGQGDGITGYQRAGIENFINKNMNSTKVSGVWNSASAGDILSAIATQNMVKGSSNLVKLPKTDGTKGKDSDYVVPIEILQAALQARFQNVGPYGKVGAKIGSS